MSTGHTGPMILAWHHQIPLGEIWAPEMKQLPGTQSPAPPLMIVRTATRAEYLASCAEREIVPRAAQYYYEVVTD